MHADNARKYARMQHHHVCTYIHVLCKNLILAPIPVLLLIASTCNWIAVSWHDPSGRGICIYTIVVIDYPTLLFSYML